MICWLKQSQWALVGIALAAFVTDALALDPNRLPSQYVREQWTIGTRFPGGAVNGISQTADGYLWIGTDKGLIRFDGFSFRPIPLTPTANASILQLLTDGEGKLWIRSQGAYLLHQKDGAFEGVRRNLPAITAVSKDTNGAILASDIEQGAFRFIGDDVQKLAPDVLPGLPPVVSMAETADERIWMGTLGSGLFYLADGRATKVSAGLPNRKIICLLPVGSELWAGTDTGLYRGNINGFRRIELPSFLHGVRTLSILRDRDSNLWVGTALGLLRINAKGISFSEENEVRGEGGISALFEDREGNLWVGGARGLGRVRDSAFITYSSDSDHRFEHNGPVYVDEEGRIWFAPAQGGLFVLRNGRAETVAAIPAGDVVYSIAGRANEIWVGRQRGGLTHFQFHAGGTNSQTYTLANGLAENSVYAVYESRDGSVWAGTLSGGVSRLKDGHFTTYTTANGLAANAVSSIIETRDGAMWFGTSDGLSSFSNRQWKTYTMRDGLPSSVLNCLFQDSTGTLWSGTSDGLAFFASDHFRVPLQSPEILRGQIFGIAEDKNGSLWIATSNHVLRVNRDKLMHSKVSATDVHEYGPADGLPSNEGVNRSRSLIADPEGKIWFSLNRGLSVLDPSHLAETSVPAIAHIETVFMDGTPVNSSSAIRVSSSHKRITFAYTALSLAVPERIRFRYRVDDFDKTWSEPVATREAVYTNLSPGSYRFRVVASNSQGEWNGSESAIMFEVAPAFWQTWWFRSAMVVFAALTTLLLYRLHLRRLTQQLNMRFEERLAERARIAQELHDTLLQGVLSASMQLHVANARLGTDSPAKPLVSRVLELMGGVIEDGRNAIRGLRVTKENAQDLDQAFLRIPQELLVQSQAEFHVLVEGAARALHPVIRDEVYTIGREALANAFRHSRAKTIQVELEYGAHDFRLLVQDDGCGIDVEVLHAGRDGHWGLSGMRERSEKIGAKLTVLSKAGDGTEVELRIPARIAFKTNSTSGLTHWLSRINPRRSG